MAKKFCILSVDGGGLKGLIAIKILQTIEMLTGGTIGEQFDLLAGTSTGGLIVCAMAGGKGDGDTAFNLESIENMYLKVGQDLFRNGGLSYSDEDVRKFEALLLKTFGERKLSDLRIPVVVPTFDTVRKKLVLFKTRSALSDKSKDVPLTEVCRATTAIMPVFPAFRMKYHGLDMRCVDAGPYLKNPALSTLAEVWKHKAYYHSPGLREEDIVLLSVSTGSYRQQAADWSLNINEVIHSQEMDMGYIASQELRISFEKVNYLRVDMNLGGSAFSLMQLFEWMERIQAFSTNDKFKKDIKALLC